MSDDPRACCILGICCPPGSVDQFEALVQAISKANPKLSDARAAAAAYRVLSEHDHFRRVKQIVDAVVNGES
jgi:hypothetical protein